MLHLENFFEKSFALLLTTPILKKTGKKWLTIGERSGIIFNVAANSNSTIMTT